MSDTAILVECDLCSHCDDCPGSRCRECWGTGYVHTSIEVWEGTQDQLKIPGVRLCTMYSKPGIYEIS